MHEFNPWFNDQSFTHTALSKVHTHTKLPQHAPERRIVHMDFRPRDHPRHNRARAIHRHRSQAILCRPFQEGSSHRGAIHCRARKAVTMLKSSGGVMLSLMAALDMRSAWMEASTSPVRSIRIKGKTRVLPNAADLDPSTHCGPKLGRDSP